MSKEDVLKNLKNRLDKSLEALSKEFSRVRTGRANIAILDGVKVDCYGAKTPLNQVASLSVPDPRTIMIQPWDKGVIGDVEKAILKSDLGLTPANDGNVIRIRIPDLTEERRKELTKVVRSQAEDCHVSQRHGRREAIDALKKLEKEKEITEDELRKYSDEVQKKIDEYGKKVDEILKKKEAEIMEV